MLNLTACAGHDGSTYRIYHATSPDGLTWAKYDNTIPADLDTTSTNGRIPLGATPGRGDFYYLYSGRILRNGNKCLLWYTARVSNVGAIQIYHAIANVPLPGTRFIVF